MNGISVRQAVLSDIDDLAVLFDGYRQFYGRDSDIAAAKAFLLARFHHGESVLFIAFAEDKPVGFVQLYPSFSSVSLARTFILNDLFVDGSVRKKGIATLLISATIEYSRTVGAIRLSLATAINNETAQALYQAMGWQRDEAFFTYHFAIPT